MHAFSDLFFSFLLGSQHASSGRPCGSVFQLKRKRLARILMLMAEYGKPVIPESLIPKITQETLAGWSALLALGSASS